jgi:hypothetical protein
MSAHDVLGFRGLAFFFTVSTFAVSTAGLTGCTAVGELAPSRVGGATMAQDPGSRSIVAGAPRLVGVDVNARAPVSLAVEDGAVTVRFSHVRSHGTMIRLDPFSLAAESPEVDAPAPGDAPPSFDSVRLNLGDDRFIECFKSGDVEQGYRLMAQAWTASGARLGDPITISDPDADVLGAPRLIAIDDEHAMAAFVVMRDDGAELLGVSLQVP